MRRPLDAVFAGRFRVAGLVVLAFLAISLATRIGLALFNGDPEAFSPPRLLAWLLLGTVFDLAVGALPEDAHTRQLLDETTAYYQVASETLNPGARPAPDPRRQPR